VRLPRGPRAVTEARLTEHRGEDGASVEAPKGEPSVAEGLEHAPGLDGDPRKVHRQARAGLERRRGRRSAVDGTGRPRRIGFGARRPPGGVGFDGARRPPGGIGFDGARRPPGWIGFDGARRPPGWIGFDGARRPPGGRRRRRGLASFGGTRGEDEQDRGQVGPPDAVERHPWFMPDPAALVSPTPADARSGSLASATPPGMRKAKPVSPIRALEAGLALLRSHVPGSPP